MAKPKSVKKISESKLVSQPKEVPKGKERMEEVYVKAAALFKEKGYLRTTMNDIAKELNIQKGSLYYYIKDKETLLFQILDRTTDNLLESVRDLPLKHLSTKEKLERVIIEHSRNIRRHQNEIPLLINEIKNLRPKLREVIISKREQYEKIFLDSIDEGFSNKTFIKHDKQFIAFLVLGGVYWFYQWFSPGEEQTPELIAKNFSKFIFNGLLVKNMS